MSFPGDEEIACSQCAGMDWIDIHIGRENSFIICPNCRNYPVLYFDDQCEACGYVINPDVFKVAERRNWSTILSLDPYDDEITNYNVCCNLPHYLCDCTKPITWEQVRAKADQFYVDKDADIKEAVEKPKFDCFSCALFHSPACIPLRVAARNAFESNFKDWKLVTPCSRFINWDEMDWGVEIEEIEEEDIVEINQRRLLEIDYEY